MTNREELTWSSKSVFLGSQIGGQVHQPIFKLELIFILGSRENKSSYF